ncbi:MAG TPA: sugar-binding protein [Treponema sp.]|nr:MAG: sugar-binding protein [Treponema sp. GWC1_61_84]OHE75601.1 MAG: sugar-binding protein [Treponema sp. RIFOXYC1_FULL_61_9]HCM27523.1 sugar-binding protein [Treponema sp.]
MDYDENLMVKASYYYYFEDMTQQDIAKLMGISRIRIIKLLEKARQTGIIQFKLRKNAVFNVQAEQKLIKKYHLNDVYIIPTPADPEQVNASIANAGSIYICDRLSENMLINMGYGDTAKKLLNNLATMTETPISCVSLTGGVSYYLPDTRSNVFNASLHLIPAPLIASSVEMAQAIRNETSVNEIFRMVQLASVTVVGIGAMHENSTIFSTGTLNRNDLHLLRMKGAVGDILSHFVDKDGNLIPNFIEDRLIGLSLEKLKELNNVIGVAAGLEKVDAIRAVLRGRYLDVLITDSSVAEKLLEDPQE